MKCCVASRSDTSTDPATAPKFLGAKSLAESLCSHRGLKLNLEGNFISRSGAESFQVHPSVPRNRSVAQQSLQRWKLELRHLDLQCLTQSDFWCSCVLSCNLEMGIAARATSAPPCSGHAVETLSRPTSSQKHEGEAWRMERLMFWCSEDQQLRIFQEV